MRMIMWQIHLPLRWEEAVPQAPVYYHDAQHFWWYDDPPLFSILPWIAPKLNQHSTKIPECQIELTISLAKKFEFVVKCQKFQECSLYSASMLDIEKMPEVWICISYLHLNDMFNSVTHYLFSTMATPWYIR